jgi:4-diphosphocytidyl-2-C-methyl-D-erythritol kinase
MHVVVARPPVGLSTADVYRRCRTADEPVSIQPLLSAVERGDSVSVGRQLMNRLQQSAELLTPWVQRLRPLFDRLGCLGHQMSGSGSSYFGIFRTARHARRAAGYLRAAGVGLVLSARTVSTGRSCFSEASHS